MAHRGMTKLRKIEKAGLVVLCVVMLGMLGIGTGPALRGCGESQSLGSFVIAGDEIKIEQADYRRYGSYLSMQNFVLRVPPPWQYPFSLRYYGIDPVFRDYQAGEKDLWTFIVLEHLARRAGIRVPPKAIAEWIRRQFSDREGNYNRDDYEAFVRSAGSVWPTASDFEAMLGKYLAVEYFLTLYDPLLRPPMSEIYDNWRFRNKRHDVKFLVQDVAPLRAELDPASFTEEELQTYYDQGTVKGPFRIPTKRSFEAAYLLPADLSAEDFEKLKKMAEEKELLSLGLEEPFQYFYANEDDYSLMPIVDRLRKEWEEAHPKKEEEEAPEKPAVDEEKPPADEEKPPADVEKPVLDVPEEEKPVLDVPEEEKPVLDVPEEEEPVLQEEFKDPTVALTPREKFDTYFKERVERELFVKKLMIRLLDLERIEKIGLKEVVEKYGLSHFLTEKPLDEYAIGDLETIGSQDLRRSVAKFQAGRKDEYCDAVVEIGEDEKRGWLFFKLIEVVAAHYPGLKDEVEADVLRNAMSGRLPDVPYGDMEKLTSRELLTKAFPDAEIEEKEGYTVEDVMRLLFRQGKAEDLAKERLQEVRDLVVGGGQTLASAAEEKGFEVHVLKGISKETPRRQLITAEEGAELTPDQVAENRSREIRNFIVKGRMSTGVSNMDAIDRTEPEQFVEEVLTDKAVDAAFLVLVTSHQVPAAEEMPAVDSRMIRLDLQDRTKRSTLRSFFSFDLLKERYRLEVPFMEKKEEEKRPGQ